MTKTVAHLAAVIIDQAGAIGLQAEALDGDSIIAAEAIICMRNAQREMNQAADAMARAVAMRSDKMADRPTELYT
jgi:hypothetical protein